jgi:hypothetical protein
MDDLATCGRRRFLCGVLAGSLISMAGCSGLSGSDDDGVQDSDGDGVIDSEDYAPQDPDVQDKSDIGSGESTPETPTSTETATPTPTEEIEREAYNAYELGNERIDDADDAANSAGDSLERENYERSEERYRNALEDYENAIDDFDSAADLATSAGHPEAEEMAAYASNFLEEYLVRFTETGIDVAEAAQNGDFDRADNLIDDMDSIITEKNDTESIATEEEFQNALDL